LKKSNLHTLEDAIREYLKAYKLDSKLAETRAVAAWKKLMGQAIFNHTKDLYIQNKKLYVILDSAVLREELSFAKEKIKNMMNKEAGVIVVDEVILK
jgi:predicted nucleic acid-binding Zn ribbon protein